MTDIAVMVATSQGRRRSRAEIIDRAAEAMAYRKGRTWARMTVARRDQMRTQVRAVLWALLPDSSEACSFVAVEAAANAGDGIDAFTLSQHFDAYLREVLA